MSHRTIVSLLFFFLFVTSTTNAKNTPMEALIARVKETNTLEQVSNIWYADNNLDRTALLQKVEHVQPLVIDYAQVAGLVQQKTFAISLELPGINGGSYTLDLARYDFLSNDFQVRTSGLNGTDGIVGYTPGLYYRGIVHGIPGSVAAFSFFNDAVYGVFSIPGEGNYTLVPNTGEGGYFGGNLHYILYNDNELKIKDHAPQCAADQLPDPEQSGARTTTTVNNNVYNNCTEVRVFEEADYAMYQSKGSSTANVTNYLTALFNNQSTLYRNEGIPIVLKYVQINTVSDRYQSLTSDPAAFLTAFGQETMNTMHGCDVALLLSTRYGTLGGIAWLQAMCSPYNASQSFGPYGFCNIDNSAVVNFPTFSWDVEVTTHEMGHIVGSPHTHRCCWNPPGTGTTAIDGCYTMEGTCANPGLPAGGGTIMSYCHLTSVGINFANGFGQQPGDTIRYFISHRFSSSCGATYNPGTPLAIANRTKVANRECTDASSGLTYYWNDNNTADQTDDTLVLIMNKGGNNIGNLDVTGFGVGTATLPGYGSGSGVHMSFPAGTPSVMAGNVAMNRYWSVTATTTPASAVEVMFPFTAKDTSDIDGSLPRAVPLASLKMYKVNNPTNPDPASGISGATASSVSVYNYGTAASTTNWSLSNVGGMYLAHMKMTNLSGGGTGFYTYARTAFLQNLAGAETVATYPNPVHDRWNVSVENAGGQMLLRIYTIDGKLLLQQQLAEDRINEVNTGSLPAGMYYYRIVGGSNVYMGSLLKQ